MRAQPGGGRHGYIDRAMSSPNRSLLLLCFLAIARVCPSQTVGATFGDVVRLGGTPSDIVLDESRSRLYLVNANTGQVDIYNYANKNLAGSIRVGSTPVAAAMSMDSRYLYVSNNASSSLSVIDLNSSQVLQTVSLPSKPEGVEVGADGRALITTEGTGTTTDIQSLYVFDVNAQQTQQLTPVQFSPPPPTPSTLPGITIPRPTTTFRGKLVRTPDGSYIVGLSTVNNNASTVLFVYETASSSILRSRTVTGQSTILSMAPDGSRFMAGFTLYDTGSLGVMAQQSVNNLPFPLSSTANASFNTVQNVGGSAFTPDGKTLYSAFNSAPASTPATRAQASTLLISNSDNLATRLGIKMPESIIAKMVMLSDESEAWGLSESGLLHLPLGRLYDYPMLQPESTAIFLSNDTCSRGMAGVKLQVNNLGKGKLTFSVPAADASLIAQASTGMTPGTITFTMEPGRTGVTRQYGTNLYSGGGATNSGTPLNLNLASPEAINIPNTIRVYMNNRQSDQRGVVYPLPVTPTNTEGLTDILIDEARNRVYIANSGYNRIEVFDIAAGRFTTPIDAGQFPHQMTLDGDGRTLWVANSGGESISMVDLELRRVTGSVQFPPIPRSGTANPVTPQALIAGISGVNFIKSDGSQWKVLSNQATLRQTNSVTPAQIANTTAQGPVRMVSGAGGRSAAVLGGTGTVYLYDALADTFTVSNRIYTQTNIQGYFGPLAAAPDGSYFLANGLVLNSSLSVIGGSELTSSTSPAPFATTRNVVAVAALDENRFLRLTTQARQNLTATGSGETRPTLELADLRNGSVSVVGALAENPAVTVFGATRANITPRQLAVHSSGTAYALTLSGLSVIPLTDQGAAAPQIASGAGAIVNGSDATANMQPGSFIIVRGSNLAANGAADQIPAPTLLGGSCVTLSDLAIPLLQTSSGQITAQLPEDLRPGMYTAQVRSLATGQQSQSVVVTVR
jgi:YVTN family beta-propeller protein